jgi:hypothetical protein
MTNASRSYFLIMRLKWIYLHQLEHVQPIFRDHDIRERLASITSPVTQQTWLDVLLLQWLLEKRVLLEVEHTEAKVQGGVKVAGELVDFIFAQWLASDGRASLVVDRPLGLAVGERALGHLGRHCTDCECSFSLFW